MGPGISKTAFSFKIVKSGGQVLFEHYNVSGSNTIVKTESTSTTVRFYWNNNENAYITSVTGGFFNYNNMRELEFKRINDNYYIKVDKVNNQYVEFGLYGNNLSFISWLSMLSIVQAGFELYCSCTVSTGASKLYNTKLSNPFRYLTMISPGNISNNGIYYNQEGSTVYFNNDTVDVNIITEQYTGLTNEDGYYLIDVNISKDGNITLITDYFPYSDGYVRLDTNTLLIKTTLSPNKVKGIMLSNTNSNGMFILNRDIILDQTSDGIICRNINNDMSFTILISITDVTL